MCGNHPNEQQQRFMYCVCVTIKDETGTTTATLFDEAVYSLAHIDAMTMVVEKAFEDPNTLPDPLHVIIGQTKKFQLQFNNRNQQGSTRFKCNKVLEETNIPHEIPQESPPIPEQQQLISQENTSNDTPRAAEKTHT